jgi:hypothetical protein
MVQRIAIEASLRAGNVQLHNIPLVCQDFQISVHCGDIDSRESAAHHLVKLISRRVAGNFSQFFENDLSLFGHSARRSAVHVSGPPNASALQLQLG